MAAPRSSRSLAAGSATPPDRGHPTQWLDIDGVSYHFDETGALTEYKASGTVTVVFSETASTPSPTRWAIGGAVLVLLAWGSPSSGLRLRLCDEAEASFGYSQMSHVIPM